MLKTFPSLLSFSLTERLVKRRTGTTIPAIWYGRCVIVVWAFYMLLRRLADFVAGYQELNPITILPLIAMLPLIIPLVQTGCANVPRAMKAFAWVWLGVFTLGFAVSFVALDLLSGAFGFGDFIFPMAFGLWITTKGFAPGKILETFGTTIAWCAVLASLYAFFQFAVLPPWDAAWMLNGGAQAIGAARPYELRAFSTLTAPSTYAAFTVCAMVITLYLTRSRPLLYVPFLVLDGAALAITLERSCWIALSFGVFVYLLFSPNRGRASIYLFALGLTLSGIVSVAAVSTPKVETTLTNLSLRLATLDDPSADVSVRSRQQQTEEAIEDSKAHPLGMGLGLFGVAHRLRDSTDPATPNWIDNGYLARLVELGWAGFAGYLTVTLGAIGYTLHRWRQSPPDRDSLAVALALQAVLCALDASHDHHSAFLGVIFWFAVSLATTINLQKPIAARN